MKQADKKQRKPGARPTEKPAAKKTKRSGPDAQNSAAAAPKKPRGRPFKKGQSGNPGGRKPVPKDIKDAFRNLTPKAIKTLEEALDEGGAVAVRAAETIIERAWGRAPQSLEVSSPDGSMTPQTVTAAVVVLPAELPVAPTVAPEAVASQPVPALPEPKE